MNTKLINLFALLAMTSITGYSQGILVFDNVDLNPVPLVSINTLPGASNPVNGPAGAYIGSDYTASLYYLNGVVTDQAVFDGSNPILFASADTPFLGVTGFTASNG